MSRRDLPLEVSSVPLSFDELLDTVRQLEGERAVLNLVSADPAARSKRPAITLVGPLELDGNPELHLRLGDPALFHAHPESFTGGTLALRPEEFRAATLTTLDGNDYFILAVQLEGMRVIIQDDDSGIW